ncbi:amino acid transporter-like protein [Diplogelasinospora grovesii]|uniref:Amino acid transporter-like protein n=1 Tax=Diplogelasinospora grovesii TaxID=303347 RepID=A0AAN6S0G4_9PEZI|nr:amino acid transporter-like protein [Diplogelasinospora grovesii]
MVLAMAPPPLSSASVKSPRRFSSTAFISGAISTAASPLQASFNLSCRSPIRPSHDATEASRPPSSRVVATSSANYGNSPYLEPPSFLASLNSSTRPGSKVSWSRRDSYSCDGDENDHDTKSISSSEDLTAADDTWFLQPSPGLPPDASSRNSHDEGKLGVVSAINIIVGKTVGVGAYSVPSAIFAGVGSVGMTLLLWVVGSLISFCGLAVYLDLGTAMPRSGGERVYLERIFRRPRMLATCMFMSYVVLLGFSTPNAIVLGEYALYALDVPVNRWNVRMIAVAAVSSLCWAHAQHPRLGLRLINVLGVAKMLILVIVILSGMAGGLMGVGADREGLVLAGRREDAVLSGVAPRSTAQRNFSDIWSGSSFQPYDYATALLKVVYCFRGYSTANQVLSDVRDPVRTLRVAAPVALSLVSLAYLAITVAFFLVVDKDDFKSAGVVVAGIFFRNVFGPGAGSHILPLFVIISAAGNIAATSFAQARVNEELAKDGLLPWSRFWTAAGPTSGAEISSEACVGNHYYYPLVKFKQQQALFAKEDDSARLRLGRRPPTPSRGLLLHWLISVLAIALPPPGRIYNFLVDIGGYPVSVISVAVSIGLLYLHNSPSEGWTTPFRAPRLAVVLFAASNCLLLLLPWIPPAGGKEDDAGGFVWFAYPATALAVLATGAVWWVWWVRWGNGRAGATGNVHGGDRTNVGRRNGHFHGLEGRDSGEDEGLLSEEDEGGGGSIPAIEVRKRAPCGCPMAQ